MDVRLLAWNEVDVKAVVFRFDGCLGFDPGEIMGIGRALNDHSLCGHCQGDLQ